MRNHFTSLFLSFMYGSSITDPYRLSLEATSAKWFRGVWICGFVVALGCALETWEVTFTLRNWWRSRKKRDPLHDNPGSWRHLLAAIGLFFVVGGIVGETIFEVLDSNVESQLRSHASDLISDAEHKTDIADGKAGDAETKAAQLEKDAEGLKKAAEDERLARVNLEKNIQPRTISVSDRQTIAKQFKKFVPNFAGRKVELSSTVGDAEGMSFSLQIEDILNRAGIPVDDSKTGLMEEIGALHTGTQITGPVKDKDFMMQLASDLHKYADKTAVLVEWDDTKYSQVGVTVEAKPVIGLLPTGR
jgi:hypothetical protein